MRTDDLSDEALLCRLADDEAALEELYRRWGPRIAGVARAAGLAEADRADVLQVVLAEIWRHARRFDPKRGTAAAWILTVARRRVIDATRRRQTMRESLEMDGREPAADVTVEDRIWLASGLARLSERERRLLQLEYWGGFTQTDVARMWKVPLGTVKTWNRRALAKLREVMADASDHGRGGDGGC
jgi:RNA polymerase sigma-70 factor (ECF subfamily)